MLTTTRLALITVLATVVAAVLASRTVAAAQALLVLPPHLWSAGHINHLLVVLLGSVGAIGALWYALSGALALMALATPHRRGNGRAARLLARWGAPYVRRAAAGALATSLIVLPGTAVAQEAPPVPDDLGWTPSACATADPTSEPDATGGEADPCAASPPPSPDVEAPAAPGTAAAPDGAATQEATPDDPTAQEATPDDSATHDAGTPGTPAATRSTAPQDSTPAPDASTYVVQAGDSLWAITSSHLDSATPAEVATVWPALYRANDDVIGQDPDLIHPGTVLTLPGPLTDQA